MFFINAAISNLAINTVTAVVVSNLPRQQGRQKQVSVPVENFFSGTQQGTDGVIFRDAFLPVAERIYDNGQNVLKFS